MSTNNQPIYDLFLSIPDIDFSFYEKKKTELLEFLQKYVKYFKDEYQYIESWDGPNQVDYHDPSWGDKTFKSLSEYLRDSSDKKKLQSTAELIIYLLEQILVNTDRYYASEITKFERSRDNPSVNMYSNPEILLSHTFESVLEDEQAKSMNNALIKEIKNYFDSCFNALTRAITPQTYNYRTKPVPSLNNSMDVMLALNLVQWLIIYDEDNAANYIKDLKIFLEKTLLSFSASKRDLNPYIKALFRDILENSMKDAPFAYDVPEEPEIVIVEEVEVEPKDGKAIKIYVTGVVEGYTKEQLKAFILSKGMSWASGVTKSLDFLVVADKAGIKRQQQAYQYGIKTISWERFKEKYLKE